MVQTMQLQTMKAEFSWLILASEIQDPLKLAQASVSFLMLLQCSFFNFFFFLSPVPFEHIPFLFVSFPLLMAKGLWQRKGVPGPGSGGLQDVCKLM